MQMLEDLRRPLFPALSFRVPVNEKEVAWVESQCHLDPLRKELGGLPLLPKICPLVQEVPRRVLSQEPAEDRDQRAVGRTIRQESERKRSQELAG
jgi:hypothetical protein